MRTLIINDLHIGVNRQAGTTPTTQQALRAMPLDFLCNLPVYPGDRLIINGDLFNSFSIDVFDLIATFDILRTFTNKGVEVVLIAGNHDASAKGSAISSFQALCHFLKSEPLFKSVMFDSGFTQIGLTTFTIPHMTNQTSFNRALESVASVDGNGKYLLLHCNVMNGFAEQMDHSLNIEREQIEALLKSGWTMIVGHEHVAQNKFGNRLIITGNQVPTSISDVIGEGSNKRYLLINEVQKLEIVDCGSYPLAEMDWREIAENDSLFIRITGECSVDESSQVLAEIAKYRSKSSALVIGNSVKVNGLASLEGLEGLNLETLQTFDIMAVLLPLFDPEEQEIVKGLKNAA